MKMTYNTPSVTVCDIQMNVMMAGSLHDQVGNGIQLSKESFFDDDDSEEEE